MLKVKVKSIDAIKETFESNALYRRHADDTQTFVEGMAFYCGKEIEVTRHPSLDQFIQKLDGILPSEFYWHRDWVTPVVGVAYTAGEELKKGDLCTVDLDTGIVMKVILEENKAQ